MNPAWAATTSSVPSLSSVISTKKWRRAQPGMPRQADKVLGAQLAVHGLRLALLRRVNIQQQIGNDQSARP